MIYFDDQTAADLLDALRLLEGRLLGSARRLSPGARELRRSAERSLAVKNGQLSRAEPDSADAVSMSASLIDTPAAATVLGVSDRTVRRLVADGDLRSVVIGRSRRFRPADLDAFAETRSKPHPVPEENENA